tara:strand:+ start:22734 stop:22925 length:192 start_codon:yes stop_codon:yes gene_type:complete
MSKKIVNNTDRFFLLAGLAYDQIIENGKPDIKIILLLESIANNLDSNEANILLNRLKEEWEDY